jgi:hypothetical protein
VATLGARHALGLQRSILQPVIALHVLGRLRKASDGPVWIKMEGMGGRLKEWVMMEGGGKENEGQGLQGRGTRTRL